MGLKYHFTDTTLIFSTTGDLDHHDGLAILKEGLDQAGERKPGKPVHLLFDIRHSEEDRSPEDLRRIAMIISDARPVLSMRCALVAADPLHFGLSRMFATFMDSLQFKVDVFRDYDTAVRWLEAET